MRVYFGGSIRQASSDCHRECWREVCLVLMKFSELSAEKPSCNLNLHRYVPFIKHFPKDRKAKVNHTLGECSSKEGMMVDAQVACTKSQKGVDASENELEWSRCELRKHALGCSEGQHFHSRPLFCSNGLSLVIDLCSVAQAIESSRRRTRQCV